MALARPGKTRDSQTLRRSRFGCRNCKLRKLKCDECRPQCKRCDSFGVLCNFVSGNISDLQPLAADTRQQLLLARRPELRPPPTNAVWTSDSSTSYQLNTKCQDFVTRYLGRSLITPNDPSMIHVNRKLLELAFAYPFLMHASLAVAFTYDRHLNGSLDCRRTLEECYHRSQSTTLLNKRLKKPIDPSDRDPIWGTAAALALLTFSSPDDARGPDQAWPLRSSESSDLDWLHMSKGKMSLWHIINPLRPDSLFSVMAMTFAHMLSPLPERGVDGVPRALAAVYCLQDSSTAETNRYFLATHAVSRILILPDSEVTTGLTQLFTRTISGSFKEALWGRDALALLLLYLWYCKASRSIWWIALRAKVELPAICCYLQVYHKDNEALQTFLPGGAFDNGEWD